jgi:hypothetical protein
MDNNSAADNFYEALVNNPKEIIEWCKKEIMEYEKLIILEE